MANNQGVELRNTVLNMLLKSLENGELSSLVLKEFYNGSDLLSKQDKGFVTGLYLGTLEKLVYIDFMINRFSNIKLQKMKPAIRNILRLSVFQIIFMDSVPERAALSEAQKLCDKRKLSGLKGFVNGVLRAIQRGYKEVEIPESTAVYFPKWLYELIIDQYGKDNAAKFFDAVNAYDNSLTVRLHTRSAGKDKIKDSLTADGCEIEEIEGIENALRIRGFSSLTKLKAFENGWFSVQDISSMMPVYAAANEKDVKLVIDTCAAPGGKSMLFADAFPDANIVSMDVSDEKIGLIKENVSRMGYENISAIVNDARHAKSEFIGKADVVLCDAPCSGLGVIGKKPDIKLRVRPEELEGLAALQREILTEACKYVKPGGLLIYSTCTVNKSENIDNAKWFAGELQEFCFESLAGKIPAEVLDEAQKTELESGALQMLPGRNRCDGFFIAAFRKLK